jgi:type IV pilus assembly protein PilM
MAKKVVTLYIDDTAIRLLVCRGNTVKKWAELQLQPGQIESTVIIQEEDVARQLTRILKDSKIKTKKVIVGLSGLHCLTRPVTLPMLPKAMMDEAVIREARRLLPVPPEQLYIMWKALPSPEGKTNIFLVALPRRTVDSVVRMLQLAKLTPSIMGVKPLAMASLVQRSTAIILDVQLTEFDIVIMVDGIPQPIRTVPFPSHTLSWEERLSIIVSDLDRTIKFYNSNSPDSPLKPSVPIYVAGEIVHQPELCRALSDGLGYPVSALESPMKRYKSLAMSRYLVNIGLALQEPSFEKISGPSIARSNYLPVDYRPKPISWPKVVTVPSAVTLAGAIIPLVMSMSSTSANIDSTSEQLDMANKVLAEKQIEKKNLGKDIADLEKKIAAVQASISTFNSALENIEVQGENINSTLNIVMENLPRVVQLGNINCSGDALSLSGVSPGEEEVLIFARNLRSSGWFTRTTITGMHRGEGDSMSFTIILAR